MASLRALHAERAHVAEAANPQLVSVPVPAVEIRAHTGRIENALAAARDLDFALEVALVSDGAAVDDETVRDLVEKVRGEAGDLSERLRALPAQFGAGWQEQAAHGYVGAATRAYAGLLARIAVATARLASEGRADAEILDVVTAMLDAHPWRTHRN